MDSSNICLLLGNALDNAVEAAEQVPDVSKRVIQVRIDYRQEALFLEIVNPYCGEIATDARGQYLSRKREYSTAGIGMQSMRKALAGNKGAMEVNHEDNCFCLRMVLYGVKTPA